MTNESTPPSGDTRAQAGAGINIDLTGRGAIVTGAGAGIGRAIAGRLAEAGATVAVMDIDPDRAESAATEIRDAGGRAEAVVADVLDHRSFADAIERFAQVHHLEIAVNNVGNPGGSAAAPFLETTLAEARTMVERNLMATYMCCLVEAQQMKERGGVILNVSSGEARRPSPQLAAYGAAKAAVNHLTRTLAVELGPYGIRVNAIAPGTVYTETVRAFVSEEDFAAIGASYPLQRSCVPDDLGRLSVYLASELAASVTGQIVAADNGAALGSAPVGVRPTLGYSPSRLESQPS